MKVFPFFFSLFFCSNFLSGQPFFHEIAYTGDKSKDAAFIASDVSRVLKRFGEEKYAGVVMDNCSTNTAAWRILETEFPLMLFSGKREREVLK